MKKQLPWWVIRKHRDWLVKCLIARDGNHCFYCRLNLENTRHRTIDHVVPRSKGGKTVFGNLALSCLQCNRHKGDMSRWAFERSVWLSDRRGDILKIKMAATRFNTLSALGAQEVSKAL